MARKVFRQPLVLHFIWHPDDANKVMLFVRGIKKMLARDVDRPFSRELNIPVFFWDKINKDIRAEGSPYGGDITIVFPFVSSNTKGCDDWKSFYEGLPCKQRGFSLIPVSIEKGVFHSKGSMRDMNAIRAFEWDGKDDKCRELLFDVTVAHSIYSFAYADGIGLRGVSPLTLFFSHCKKGGVGEQIAQRIKAYMDSETSVKTFFDKTEIMSGEAFSSRILRSIDNATLVLVETDLYSASHWCQIEVVRAKKTMRPIVSIDFRNHFEDRVFPGCANIPSLHVRHDILNIEQNEAEIEFLRILEVAFVETLRCRYNYSRLLTLRTTSRIPTDAVLLVRPPELSDLGTVTSTKKRNVIVYYPEPPVFQEESDWYSKGIIDARTPLWCNQNIDEFRGLKCGISVSEPDKEEFGEMLQVGHTPDSIQRLIQDISRHLLGRGAKLLYGGDLREKDESGFTRFILDEAKALRERGIKHFPKIENHLAWPLSIDSDQLRQFKANNDTVLTVKAYPLPKSFEECINAKVFLKPDTARNQCVWAMSLTSMRKQLISKSDVRVCAGGRRNGYKGSMPGVLEEVLLALKASKPLYLLGGFGGVVQDIVAIVCHDSSPESLTEEWQLAHTIGYDDVLHSLTKSGVIVNYPKIISFLQATAIRDLAKLAGLSTAEYSRLMHSPFVDECLFLIIKGIRNIQKSKKKGTR